MDTRKIAKVEAEIGRARDKLAEWQAKLRELERRKTELENTEIVEAVRGMDISLPELADLLRTFKAKGGIPALSGQRGPKAVVPDEAAADDKKEGESE